MNVAKEVHTDNELTDWAFSAPSGQAVSYYQYRIKSHDLLLCKAREPNKDGKPNEIENLADKAWSLHMQGVLSLAQQRNDGICEYVAIKR